MYEQKNHSTVLQELGVDPKQGLSTAEAQKRLAENGENKLVEQKPKSIFKMILEQLNDPMIFILFIAAIISLIVEADGWKDAVIILAIVVINAVIGVVQEGRAQKALEALKKLSSPTAVVRRNGELLEIPAAQLVVGDIVILEAGRQVPADLRLIFSSNLKIEESALTGESVPVDKDAAFTADKELPLGDRINMAYMSTSVAYGRGEGVVVQTGMNTQIGKIASLLESFKEEATPLQKRLADLGKVLGLVALGICALLFLVAIIQGRNIIEMLVLAISLAVAAVPEGLPAVVTIVLALGVQRLVKVNTIVRRLPSVETLGSVSIVCSDKTGTLTQNIMTVQQFYINEALLGIDQLDASAHKLLLQGMMLCNDSSVEQDKRIGDPTELALVDMGIKAGLDKRALEQEMPRIDELSFDSVRKMMTTLHKTADGTVAFTKGATDEVLERCNKIIINNEVRDITPEDKENINKALLSMSNQALRVLALALRTNTDKPQEADLTFVGLVGMIDPPRPEAKTAVDEFKQASVVTIMITGDHKNTAYAIAKELGIAETPEQVITGAELDKFSEEELADKIEQYRVFARVSPENKVTIVKAFKAKGHIVSMTGDGVNDAPSLKAADIGVAMGITGTDVAKGAADMVLTDDNFATIEKAICEGRGIYANIKKSVLFLLSANFGEITTMFASILTGLAAPLRAIHILWVNLLTDSLPALALGVDENDKKFIMRQPPRDPKESLFANGGFALTLFYGIVIGLISLFAFLITPFEYLRANGMGISLENIIAVMDPDKFPDLLLKAQTYAFSVLGISQLYHAYGMRNTEKSIFTMNPFSNKLMVVAFVLGYLLQIAVTEIPFLTRIFDTVQLSALEWVQLSVLSMVPLVMHELRLLFKMLFRKKAH